jgi:4-hydroxyphenylacetate 3-monooxygenase
METPGLTLLCRPSYERAARSPFDNPLSARFDENDAVMIFDRAFIPWEHVLVYRDIERANSFYRASGFFSRYNFQSAIRLGVKLDFMVGLFAKGMAANGTDEFRGVQVALGDILAWRNLIWALTAAMALDPQPGPGASVIPRQEHAAALRVFATQCWPAVKATFETALGASPLVTPSSHRDLLNDDLRPLIDRYYRGTDVTALERIKLFKLIWDAIGSEFGGRHELYERNYSGNNEQIRLDVLNVARGGGLLDACTAFVDQCMSDYDLHGWTVAPWRGAQEEVAHE